MADGQLLRMSVAYSLAAMLIAWMLSSYGPSAARLSNVVMMVSLSFVLTMSQGWFSRSAQTRPSGQWFVLMN